MINEHQQQIIDVKETRQGLVPLMVSMLDKLDQFVRLDTPFLLDERQQRISQLQQMMNKADISEAEKYRRILTAYQIEAEYGSKMGEYQGELTLDGTTRTVHYFYLGRVALVALSLDAKDVWSWDRKQQQWLSVDSSYANDVKQAIAMAKKLIEENPGSYGPSQFDNPANPQVHRETTAEEIWRDTDGQVAAAASLRMQLIALAHTCPHVKYAMP